MLINADIFTASLLISYCSFSSLIFYILSKRLHLKRKGLSDANVVSITKGIWFCTTNFVKIYEILIVYI